VQLIDERLRAICHELHAASGKAVTINFYFTPNKDSQCFDFHPDPQDTYIHQVLGEKEWTFLKEGDSFLKEEFETLQKLKSFMSHRSDYLEERFILTQGSGLRFPYCLIHRARNLGTKPCAHLTFAWERPTFGGLIHYIMDRVRAGSSHAYFSTVDPSELIRGLSEITRSVVEEYLREFKRLERMRLDEGRKY
jgi:hypothetical protein